MISKYLITLVNYNDRVVSKYIKDSENGSKRVVHQSYKSFTNFPSSQCCLSICPSCGVMTALPGLWRLNFGVNTNSICSLVTGLDNTTPHLILGLLGLRKRMKHIRSFLIPSVLVTLQSLKVEL